MWRLAIPEGERSLVGRGEERVDLVVTFSLFLSVSISARVLHVGNRDLGQGHSELQRVALSGDAVWSGQW